MAKTGGGAAYKQLTVPQTGISQATQYLSGLQAQKTAAKKLADERAGVRKQEEAKTIREKYAIDPEAYNITDSGYSDENSANMGLSRELVKREVEIMNNAKDAALKGDYETASMYEDQAKMNRANFANEQATMATHKENFDYLLENADKLSGYAKGYENFYQAGTAGGKIIKTLNDKGEIIHMAELVDDEGKRHRQIVSAEDVRTGKWRPYLKQDLVGDVKDITDNLGKYTKRIIGKDKAVETVKWDDKVQGEAAETAIDAKLGSVEYISDMVDKFDLYDQFNIDEDNPPVNRKFSKEEKKVVRDKILGLVKANYDETYKETQLTGSGTDKTSKTDMIVEAQPMTDSTGNLIAGNFTLKSKSGKPIKGVIETNPEAEILAIRKDGDTYFAQVRALPTGIEGAVAAAMEGKTETEWTILNDAELNRAARYMGLRTAGDLSKHLEERSAGYNTTAQTETNNNNDPLGLGI